MGLKSETTILPGVKVVTKLPTFDAEHGGQITDYNLKYLQNAMDGST